MKYGLSFLPDCDPDSKSGEQYFIDAIELSVLAEEMGFEYCKITEHYLHPYGGYCPDPLIFLTAVAMRTKKIRLMTGGIIAGFHHPIQLASRLAMVDCICQGRLDVGFVRGYLPYEFDAFGLSMDESRGRFESTIKAVELMLRQQHISLETDYFSIKNSSILPRPIQENNFPIWCAATISKESFEFAARNRYNLSIVLAFSPLEEVAYRVNLYRQIYPEGKVSCFIPLILDEDHEKAISIAREHVSKYHQVWRSAVLSWKKRTSKDYDPAYSQLSDLIQFANFDYLDDAGTILAGSPEMIRPKLNRIHDTINPDVILWNVDIGAMKFAPAANTLDIFSKYFIQHPYVDQQNVFSGQHKI